MNLRFAHFGNGITVYDKDIHDNITNDFKIVAHINIDRFVHWYVIPTSKMQDEVNNYSLTANPSISITQSEIMVFKDKV